MNRPAYLATGQMIALLENLSQIRVDIHGRENIPNGAIIFVVNHFTRIETLLLPYHIYKLTHAPVWSLADASFFEGPMSGLLEKVGAVSTRDPDRDRLMVKSLLTGEANWIIFPEGRMVKDKEYVEKTRFLISRAGGRRPPHTGAATLAMRTEFYRQRLRRLSRQQPAEAKRLQALFQIGNLEPVLKKKTWIVPVNMTYYPLRARENVLSMFADRFGGGIDDRLREELLTEGTMFFAGVDIDIRFGQPLEIKECLNCSQIEQDMFSQNRIDFDDRLASRKIMKQEAFKLMERYMEAIYSMTTVNHDHLFASLLKAMPFRKIAEEDFRRRVFLLAALELEKTGVFCHRSLKIGQVALMTDDRFHKFRDFQLLSEKTEVLSRQNGLLIRNPAKFSSTFDLNRARLDNPIGVIANEVIPLKALQQQIRMMAWLPGVLVRSRVAGALERQALAEFETDYQRFHRPGESKERAVGAPVLLRGRSRDLGVVLVHGFMAAPLELAELAAYLHGAGLWVYTVRLRGHGTSPEDLAIRTGSDWVESVDLGYALMSATCKRVVVGGFSFGGGVALDCAARINKVAGVFAVCPPFRLQNLSSRLAPVVASWNKVMDWLNYDGAKKEFVKTFPERPEINYDRMPVAGLWEMVRFMKELESKMVKVLTPALVVQSMGDPMVDPEGTKEVFTRLGATDKVYQALEFNRHGIVAGEEAERVHGVIGAFIERLRG